MDDTCANCSDRIVKFEGRWFHDRSIYGEKCLVRPRLEPGSRQGYYGRCRNCGRLIVKSRHGWDHERGSIFCNLVAHPSKSGYTPVSDEVIARQQVQECRHCERPVSKGDSILGWTHVDFYGGGHCMLDATPPEGWSEGPTSCVNCGKQIKRHRGEWRHTSHPYSTGCLLEAKPKLPKLPKLEPPQFTKKIHGALKRLLGKGSEEATEE